MPNFAIWSWIGVPRLPKFGNVIRGVHQLSRFGDLAVDWGGTTSPNWAGWSWRWATTSPNLGSCCGRGCTMSPNLAMWSWIGKGPHCQMCQSGPGVGPPPCQCWQGGPSPIHDEIAKSGQLVHTQDHIAKFNGSMCEPPALSGTVTARSARSTLQLNLPDRPPAPCACWRPLRASSSIRQIEPPPLSAR